MKKLAILLILLTAAVGGAIGYGLFRTNLQVTAKGLQKTPASEKPGEFQALRDAALGQRLLGTVLKKEIGEDPAGYSLYTYTLRLKNNGFVDAEMVEMQISPASGDVLFYGHTHVPDFSDHDGVWWVNPGSVTIPKNGSRRSYILYENGTISWKSVETGEVLRTEKL